MVHGDNAKMIAEQYNKTLSTLKYLSWPGRAEKMPTQGVSYLQFQDKILPDLLTARGYKVEVYAKGDRDSYQLVKKGSPGDLGHFEEIVSKADPSLSPIMGAVKMGSDGGNRV